MTRYPKAHLVVRTTYSKPLPTLPGLVWGGGRVRGVVVVRVSAAELFIPMQGPSSCVTQSGPWAVKKMGQVPSFCRDEFFFSIFLNGSARKFATVHPPLLVLHQLWNEVTEARRVGRVPGV